MKISFKKTAGIITLINLLFIMDYMIIKMDLNTITDIVKLAGIIILAHVFLITVAFFGFKLVSGVITNWIIAKNTTTTIEKKENKDIKTEG